MNPESIVSLKNISVFQKNNLVLDQVNFEISQGEFVYLIGKTGSGKSSLLKTMYAELPVIDGEARVVGYNLRKLKRKEIPFLRRKLGIIFQDFAVDTASLKNKNDIIAAGRGRGDCLVCLAGIERPHRQRRAGLRAEPDRRLSGHENH
jgi:ABC-type phosphate/phosphonate transport system ATPase subunit